MLSSTINKSHDGLTCLQFPSLNIPGLLHGVFTRNGGVSGPPYDSLNTSFGVGDSDENVRRNRARIKKTLGVSTLVSARQVHGNKVLDITEPPVSDIEFDGYDALITGCNIAIMIQQADCQAVLFYSPDPRVIGIVHAGWRGSVNGILGEAVSSMIDNYKINPKTMQAAISPSLGPCCGEFVNFREELPEWMHIYQVSSNHFNFHAISKTQLLDAGLRSENVHSSSICTQCNPDYYSYRRNKNTGRFASVIGLVD